MLSCVLVRYFFFTTAVFTAVPTQGERHEQRGTRTQQKKLITSSKRTSSGGRSSPGARFTLLGSGNRSLSSDLTPRALVVCVVAAREGVPHWGGGGGEGFSEVEGHQPAGRGGAGIKQILL